MGGCDLAHDNRVHVSFCRGKRQSPEYRSAQNDWAISRLTRGARNPRGADQLLRGGFEAIKPDERAHDPLAGFFDGSIGKADNNEGVPSGEAEVRRVSRRGVAGSVKAGESRRRGKSVRGLGQGVTWKQERLTVLRPPAP